MLTFLNSCKSVRPRSQSVGPWVLRARERSDVGSRSACYAELIPANNVTQKVSYVLVPRRMQWSQRKDAVQQMKRAVDAAGIGKVEMLQEMACDSPLHRRAQHVRFDSISMESGSVRSEGVVQSSLEEEKQRDTRDSVTGQSRKYAPRDPHLFLLYCLPFSSSLHITI